MNTCPPLLPPLPLGFVWRNISLERDGQKDGEDGKFLTLKTNGLRRKASNNYKGQQIIKVRGGFEEQGGASGG